MERDIKRLGPQLYNGIEKDSKAFKLLQSMGWKEGDGLGASSQGIKEHLKVKKKFDTMGMGAAEQLDRAKEWTTGMWTFDRVLSGLKEVKASHSGPASGGDSSSEDEKPVNTKKVMKAAKPSQTKSDSKATKDNKKKSKKAESSDSSSSSEGGGSSGSESDSDSDEVPNPSKAKVTITRVRAATHMGRYHKRENAKMVRKYSANDLAAILGAAPTTVAPGATAADVKHAIKAGKAPTPDTSDDESTAATSSASSGSDSDAASRSDSDGDGPKTPNKNKSRSATPSANDKVGIATATTDREDTVMEDAGPPAWWKGYFIRAGRLTDKKKPSKKSSRKGDVGAAGEQKDQTVEDKKIRISGFREQDQERLYEAVQDGATHGKQGLGRSSMPKKVAGARWSGKKTKLGSDSDSDEAGSGSGSGSESGSEAGSDEYAAGNTGQIVIVAAKSKAGAVPVTQPEPSKQPAGTEPKSKADKKGKTSSGEEKQQADETKAKGKKKRSAGAAHDEETSDDKDTSNKKRKKDSKALKGSEPAVIPSEKKSAKKQQQQERDSVDDDQDSPKTKAKKVKWAKLIKSVLIAAPKRKLSLEKLKKRVMEHDGVLADIAAGACQVQLQKKMMKKVNSCSDFEMKDGYVHLAATA